MALGRVGNIVPEPDKDVQTNSARELNFNISQDLDKKNFAEDNVSSNEYECRYFRSNNYVYPIRLVMSAQMIAHHSCLLTHSIKNKTKKHQVS